MRVSRLFAAAAAALTMAAAPPLPAAQEQRAQALMRELACPVCEGQPIAESDAPVAVEMRRRVREAVSAGVSDADIRDAMAKSYGRGVLLRPPASGAGFLLWLAPVLVFAAAVAVFIRVILGSRSNKET